MKYFLLTLFTLPLYLQAQNVNIPDANFKAYLVGNTAINTNMDSEIQESEAMAFTGKIDCSSLSISSLEGIETFIELTELFCNENNLASINLTKNTKLTLLSCTNNRLVSLNVSANDSLRTLNFSQNDLKDITISNLQKLTNLNFADNEFTIIDLSNNISLEDLRCQQNDLETLNTSGNPNLELISASRNNIKSLDFTLNTKLRSIDFNSNILDSIVFNDTTNIQSIFCANNNLTTLDLSKQTQLTLLNCFGNNLTSLNVANGNNVNMPDNKFTASDNNLSCIQVDDVTYSTNTWTNIDPGDENDFSEFLNCLPSIEIPDANFKAYLIGNSAINTNMDTEIQVSEAEDFVGSIDCSGLGIDSLDGIEFFTKLDSLVCNNNNLDSLEISTLGFLTMLNCSDNNLDTLDISSNTDLRFLECARNNISNLSVTSNIKLETINCSENNLSGLIIPATLTSMDVLQCNDNMLTNLKINNTPITDLNCNSNNLVSLDVSNNIPLQTLRCQSNQLISLDVSSDTNLVRLFCFGNMITSLDLTENKKLNTLSAASNQLTNLDIANGRNTLISSFLSFDIRTNPNLTCVNVDDISYSNTTWLFKDSQTNYSTDCASPIVNIPDNNFKNYLLGNTSINTVDDNEIRVSEAVAFTGSITSTNSSSSIQTVVGIEAFENITGINLYNNDLDSIDVSSNTKLTSLSCDRNNLSELDVSANPLLRTLLLSFNSIDTLDLSSNDSLRILRAFSNDLKSIDLSANTKLEEIYLDRNDLTSLDISANPLVTDFDCFSNSALSELNVANGNNTILTNFDARFIDATCIQVDDTAYSNANWTNKDAEASFSTDCGVITSSNNLTSELSNQFTLYPNPSYNTISVQHTSLKINSVDVLTLAYQRITEIKQDFDQVNLSNLSAGFYLLRINTDEGYTMKKIVKK